MQAGKTRRSRSMMMKHAPSKYPAGRMAVIVSKKVYKSAVKRNRIRRRIYNIVRHETKRRHVVSTDIVITVFSQEFLVMDSAHLQQELVSLLYPLAAHVTDSSKRAILDHTNN